jgi:hypothetical protein
MRRLTKLFTARASSVDEDGKTIRFKISDNKPDRMGEIVDQSWDFKNYLNNPIILWGHHSWEPENVLGTAQPGSFIGRLLITGTGLCRSCGREHRRPAGVPGGSCPTRPAPETAR